MSVSGFEQRGKNGKVEIKKNRWNEYAKTEKNDERKKEQEVLGETDRLLSFHMARTT
jgi:hypothetical protein